jgi:Arc/MetJ-type ribon-helix-helix transcriptional regulator
MAKTREPADTEQFSVTLPRKALDMVQDLVGTGLYGASRAEVARALILQRLEDLVAKGVVKLRQ